MYVIQNKVDGSVNTFVKVREAVLYLKNLKNDNSCATKEEVRELCNIFAQHNNKIAIDAIP